MAANYFLEPKIFDARRHAAAIPVASPVSLAGCSAPAHPKTFDPRKNHART
jgi:hypothetical protein